MRFASVTAVCLVGVLAAAGSVASHIGVTPGLLVVGDTQTLSLSVHNDLDRPMTGLFVRVPAGVQIVRAGGNWKAVIEKNGATWSGEPLAANTGAAFELDLAVDESTPVGPVLLQAQQLYPGSGSLPWPIPVTVIPGSGEESQGRSWAIAGGVILLATSVIVLIALRRRGCTLQEQ